ncbi:hypothetical protein [Macrococcus lamae]|uniref:CYTH domain-containing protein n=1 Tax=Macrococcus lamae TaxID=198484 RepID=A0A4R6BTN4_9STAP|nr:hypothetical protein [Macrococcus lamae]TDM10463.1 hypothetical protein ERX29_07270 [Macrococcus lamae]
MRYEVKVYADSTKVLDNKGHIDQDILAAFGAKKKDEDFLVQFIDHQERQNYHNKVTIRIRKSEDDEFLEIQYKKRYPVMDNDIQRAIEQAEADGINGELEIEYGINKQTLSVTHVNEVPVDDHILPALDESHTHLSTDTPASFLPYLTNMDTPTLIGPVAFERHKGKIDGNKIKLEKWDIDDQKIVELSAKVTTQELAFTLQQKIIEQLKALNAYEARKQLKTEIIFSQHHL